MLRKHWWVTSTAASAGMLLLAASSGLLLLASRFVDELTRPTVPGVNDDTQGGLLENWSVPDEQGEPPAELQRSLTFHALNGPELRGDFWAQLFPAPTIVICHGYRTSRARLRTVAELHYAFGNNVLFFDFRGHGQSGGKMTSGGWAEVRDLEAAIAVAHDQPETISDKIIVHGFSMGAAVALMALPHPDIAAVIADSPYARIDDILHRLIEWQLITDSAGWSPRMHLLRRTFSGIASATVAASNLVFQMRFHHPMMARPAANLKRWQQRIRGKLPPRETPILLIHSIDDELIPIEHAHEIVASAQASHIPLDLYFAKTKVHCGAYGSDPQQYVAVLRQFILRYLGFHFGPTVGYIEP